MVGSLIYTVTLVLTQRELDSYCFAFNILANLRPKLPNHNATIKNSLAGKIGMYTPFIEFSNFCIPLSKFLLYVLEYYQINLSKLSVIDAAKVSHFELMCRVLGRVPTMEQSFFWIIASVFPLSILWFDGASIVDDPLSTDEAVDLPCVEEMRFLNFVNSVNPFKTISLVDHTIQNELLVNVCKRKKKVAFVAGMPPIKKATTEGVVISDSQSAIVGKSPTTLRRLINQSSQAGTDFESAAPAKEDFVSYYADTNIPGSSYVVPLVLSTQANADMSAIEPTGKTCDSSDLMDKDGSLSATPSQDNHVICQNFLNHVTHPRYWATLHNHRNDGFLNSFNINSAQHVCMVFELRLLYEHEIMTIEKFKKKFTNSDVVIQQRDVEIVGLKAKLEQTKAEAAEVTELRKRMTNLDASVSAKTSEVATSNIHELLGKVSAFELVGEELDGKVSQQKVDCDSLRNEVVGEAKMREEFVSQQDVVALCFAERVAELDARIGDVRHDTNTNLYPHMLTAIVGRRWMVGHDFRLAVYKCARSVKCCSALGKFILIAINKGIQQGLEAGIEHGKADRPLAQVEAYDPGNESRYMAAASEFENVSFSLLEELEGLKDSPLALIMSALNFKDDHGDTDVTPKFCLFQSSLGQDGLCASSCFASGGTSAPAPFQDSSLGVSDYQVSTLVHTGDAVPVTQPHDDFFDTTVLDRPADPLYVGTTGLAIRLLLPLPHTVLPFWSKLSPILGVTGFVVAVHEISWFESCATDLSIIVFSIFALLFASCIVACYRSSSRICRFSSKASSFMAWSIFVHLSEGISILTGSGWLFRPDRWSVDA
nr:hypothetical protein [Tanacetum cinerariifolium]